MFHANQNFNAESHIFSDDEDYSHLVNYVFHRRFQNLVFDRSTSKSDGQFLGRNDNFVSNRKLL